MSLTDHPALRQHPEDQYLDLLRDLLVAPIRPDRTGTGTRSLFGRQMRFDLGDGFPLLTTKRVHFKSILVELIWFLRGDTNTKFLHQHGVSIWDEWSDTAGDLGPIYGKQMRRWSAFDSYGPGADQLADIDQVAAVLDSLRNDPYGRRHVMTLWNPADLPQMALPPCHGIAIQFYVEDDDRLSCFMHQRSADSFLGLPFNIASYALLTHMMARAVGRAPGHFVWSGGDVHLYRNHEAQAREQISRAPRPFPTLSMPGVVDLDALKVGDFSLLGYDPHPAIQAEVSV